MRQATLELQGSFFFGVIKKIYNLGGQNSSKTFVIFPK